MAGGNLRRLESLTGLRFIAAAMVVAHHMQSGQAWLPKNFFDGIYLNSGVSFFFVLSGFILQYNYRTTIDGFGFWRFIWVRFMRLWPAHVVVLVLILIIMPGSWTWLVENRPPYVLASVVALLQSWSPYRSVFFAWNAPSWSISTELWFYAAFPMLAVATRSKPFKAFAATLALSVGFLLLAQYVLLDLMPEALPVDFAYINPLARLSEFALGVLTCELMVRVPSLRLDTKAVTAIEMLLVVGVAAAVIWPGPAWHIVNPLPSVLRRWAFNWSTAPLFAALIFVFSFQRGRVSAMMSAAPLVWLGNVSFAIYLVHQPFILFAEKHSLGTSWSTFPVFLAAVIAVSAAIYYGIELRGNALARWLWPARPVQASSLAITTSASAPITASSASASGSSA